MPARAVLMATPSLRAALKRSPTETAGPKNDTDAKMVGKDGFGPAGDQSPENAIFSQTSTLSYHYGGEAHASVVTVANADRESAAGREGIEVDRALSFCMPSLLAAYSSMTTPMWRKA
jgi:hypothetical protein